MTVPAYDSTTCPCAARLPVRAPVVAMAAAALGLVGVIENLRPARAEGAVVERPSSR
ncbi:MAG TPA: hypothetical protein VLA91_11675 [Acidimicrobiia bacterium]|nr:hypothetical protein [Acidimicrobiia bacterium]